MHKKRPSCTRHGGLNSNSLGSTALRHNILRNIVSRYNASDTVAVVTECRMLVQHGNKDKHFYKQSGHYKQCYKSPKRRLLIFSFRISEPAGLTLYCISIYNISCQILLYSYQLQYNIYHSKITNKSRNY